MCSTVVSKTEVTAAKMVTQQSPVAARSRIWGGSFEAARPGLSNASDVNRWILMETFYIRMRLARRRFNMTQTLQPPGTSFFNSYVFRILLPFIPYFTAFSARLDIIPNH